MKKIAFFCIPAHGHTNPMLPVAAELVQRGNKVRFYSFEEFREKIEKTGAEFISCDRFLPELNEKQKENLKNISQTEMSIQDIRITLKMNDFLEKEFKEFQPDVVYTDSVCFWGKLNAWKFNVPMVVSTSTFAFNQLSSQYIKNTPAELADMIFGLPKISKELKTLEPYGYHVKSALKLVVNDNNTDSVVYTSYNFQPCVESFTDHYLFAGPSVFSKAEPSKNNARPLVYISLGTVVNDKPDFYSKCIEAFKCENIDVIISCGKHVDPESFGELPENIKVYQYVDQLDILSRANAFLTHCGMNSTSEGLYMATPLLLYPQTAEQHAVARRVTEINAGAMLTDDSSDGIKKAVFDILNNKSYADAAAECSRDFRTSPGVSAAADFIENAPHTSNGTDILKETNRAGGRYQIIFWLFAVLAMILFGIFVTWKYAWIIGIAAGIFARPVSKAASDRYYKKRVKEIREKRVN